MNSSTRKRGLAARLLSPEALKRAMIINCRRFPIAVIWIAVLILWGWIDAGDTRIASKAVSYAVYWCSTFGAILSVALTCWTEYLGKNRLNKPLQLAGLAFVAADGVLLSTGIIPDNNTTTIGHAAIITALCTALFFNPMRHGADGREMVRYTFAQTGNMVRSLLLCQVLTIATAIILGTISTLLVHLSSATWVRSFLIMTTGVPSMYFLANVPTRARVRRSRGIFGRKIIPAACKNVFLPLIGIYTVILYIYLFTALLSWSLPEESLCLMVSGLTAAVLLTLYGLQPYTFDGVGGTPAKIAVTARRLLPPALIPLIVLMGIGIVHRFSEYGPTVARVYTALFGVWALGVALWMTVRRNCSLNAVAMSFALGFLVVSAIPGFNVNTLTNARVRASVLEAFKGEKLPMSHAEVKTALSRMPEQQARNIASRLEYLDSWDDHSQVSDIVTVTDTDTRLWAWELYDRSNSNRRSIMLDYSGPVEIPAGYTSFKRFSYYYTGCSTISDSTISDSTVCLTAGPYRFKVRIAGLRQAAETDRPLTFTATGNRIIRVTEFSLDYRTDDPDIINIYNIKGYVFTK